MQFDECNQCGHGLNGFDGMPYQTGHGITDGFDGVRYQKGYNWWGSLMNFAKPLLRSLGKRALTTGLDIGSDVLKGEDIKESAKKRMKIAAEDVMNTALAKGKDIADDTVQKLVRKMKGKGIRTKCIRRKSVKRTILKKTSKRRLVRPRKAGRPRKAIPSRKRRRIRKPKRKPSPSGKLDFLDYD